MVTSQYRDAITFIQITTTGIHPGELKEEQSKVLQGTRFADI